MPKPTISSDFSSARIEKLRTARSGKELLQIIQDMAENVQGLSDNAQSLLKSVSSVRSVRRNISLSNDIELGDLNDIQVSGKKITPSSKIRIPSMRTVLDEGSFDAPDLSELKRDNKALHELNQGITELEVAEQVLMSSSLADLKTSQSALKAIRAAKAEAEKALKIQLTAMSKIAKKTKPRVHLGICQAVVKHLQAVLDKKSYVSIEDPKTFVYQQSDDIVHYQTYITVDHLVNGDDTVYEAYTFVVTGVLNTMTGELHHTVTSIKDNQVPGTFPIGTEVDTGSDMKRRINSLLSIDGFSATHDRRVIPVSTKYLKQDSSLPESSPNISNIRVQNDFVYVTLVPGLTDAEVKDTVTDVTAALKRIFADKLKTRRLSIRSRKQTGRVSGQTIYVFYIEAPTGKHIEITNRKLSEVADALNLTPAQVGKIRQALK